MNTTSKKSKKNFAFRFFVSIVLVYVIGNVVLFLINPYSSAWHYENHKPVPIEVMQPGDSALSLSQITDVMAAIDLAYGARKPTAQEQAGIVAIQGVAIVFFPSTFALNMKSFMGYIGPATSDQQAFTLSVKQRYNHLARLAVNRGMKDDGYLFTEESSLSKENAESFESLRAAAGNKETK